MDKDMKMEVEKRVLELAGFFAGKNKNPSMSIGQDEAEIRMTTCLAYVAALISLESKNSKVDSLRSMYFTKCTKDLKTMIYGERDDE